MDIDDLIRKAINEDPLGDLFKLAGKIREMKKKGYMVRNGKFVKRIDYTKIITPVEEHLTALYRAENVHDVLGACNKAAEVMGRQTQEAREASIKNLLLTIIADFYKEDEEDEEGIPVAPIYGVLWLMERFNTVGIADTLLEMLKQNDSFIDFYVREVEGIYTLLVAKLFKGRLDTLMDFMHERDLVIDGQQIVADGVIQMAIDEPEKREQVISWVNKLLEYYALPDTMPEPAIIDHIACSLLQIQAKECLPMLKKNYNFWRVPENEVKGGYKGLKELMGSDDYHLRVQFLFVDNYLKHFIDEERWMEEMAQLDELDEEENEYDEDDLFISDTCNAKMFTIRVKLENSPVLVLRDLTIPSCLRLSHFSQILKLAMGWDANRQGRFVKDKKTYSDAKETKTARTMPVMRCDKYAVEDVLKRKGSATDWYYDDSDGWRHSIKVVESRSCKGYDELWDIQLTNAMGACPPVFCSGVNDYKLLILTRRKQEDNADYQRKDEKVDLLPDNLEKFNIKKAQKAIKAYLSTF